MEVIMKVLIIEDNPLNMKLITEILKTEGYEYLEAEDASKGIDIARKELPDIILMDIQLPDMDGIQAMRILRNDSNTSSIKIIALTAFAMKGDRERFLREGFDGYLAKPFKYSQLINAIKDLYQHREESNTGG